MSRVFISHASKDRHFVEDELLPLLQGHGIGTWYSPEDILPDAEFERKIRAGLESCDYFLVVVSPRSIESDWVRWEVAWAAANRKGRIITVLIDDCDPSDLHLTLQPLHYADFRPQKPRHEVARGLLRVWDIELPAAEGDPSEEAAFHERFVASRMPGSPASARLNDALLAFARDDDDVPCLVQGPPGSGKSAVLAHFITAFRRLHPEALVLPYFVGSRPASTGLQNLLGRFCKALAWRFGSRDALPGDVPTLAEEFKRRLETVPAGERVVLVIDALDLLHDAAEARSLGWLPRQLPPHVKVVLGCDANAQTGDALLPALHDRLVAFVHLNPYDEDAICFEFVGYGTAAPDPTPPDRLYLDVGNALRPGVIDNHQLGSVARSTTSLLLDHPHYVRDAVDSWRQPHSPFTFVMHGDPDLDCAAAAFLANAYLTTGRFPDGARVLANYVDRVDTGHPGFTQAQPFTLYAAHLYLAHRLGKQPWTRPADKWGQWVRESLKVIGFVVERVAAQRRSIMEVDAFTCPGLFVDADRDEVRADLDRYRRKLGEELTHTRQLTLRLPSQLGGEARAETLLVRDVQNPGDRDRCIYFKDWARTDAERAGNGKGFVALSVYMSRTSTGTARCILSVTPDSGLSLEGLGVALEQAEAKRRAELGRDERLYDARSGERSPDRPGYTNPDPWYDGREQGYTIVDAPRRGTILTADEIEAIFMEFGAGRPLVPEGASR